MKDDTSEDAPASARIAAAALTVLFFTGIAVVIVYGVVAG